MNKRSEAEKIIRALAENAGLINSKIREGDIKTATTLVGERVALVQALAELHDAKVLFADSEIIEEMRMLLKSGDNEIQEAMSSIRAKLPTLLKELGTMKGARNIATYAAMRRITNPVSRTGEEGRSQGGRGGY